MEAAVVILRRMLDDRKSRGKALKVLRKEHFVYPEEKFIFLCIKVLDKKYRGRISLNSLVSFTVEKNLSGNKQERVNELLSGLAGCTKILASDFDYSMSLLVEHARRELLAFRLTNASIMLAKNKLDKAEEYLRKSIEKTDALKIDSDRRRSARTMRDIDVDSPIRSFPTGFTLIDQITGGARPGEFWLWAAFAGELKSMSLINIAYHNFIQGRNVFFATLEMEFEEVRDRLICRHAYELKKEIKYFNLKNHCLNGSKDNFMFAAEDFDTNPKYGDIEIWQPPLGTTINDVAREFELYTQDNECQILILDYINMLAPVRKRMNGRDEKNETLIRAKRLALETKGKVWLLSAYQTSTDSRKKAEEKGKYDMWAVSETIEAARSANVIVWNLMTDSMAANNCMKVGISKSRNSSKQKSMHYVMVNPDISHISRDPIEASDEDFSHAVDLDELT